MDTKELIALDEHKCFDRGVKCPMCGSINMGDPHGKCEYCGEELDS